MCIVVLFAATGVHLPQLMQIVVFVKNILGASGSEAGLLPDHQQISDTDDLEFEFEFESEFELESESEPESD